MERHESMDRESVRDRLVEYVDGELDAATRSEVEAWLQRDAALAEEANQLRESWALLDADEAPTTSSDFVASVMGKIESAPPARRILPWRPMLAAAGIVAVVGIGLVVAFGGPKGSGTGPGGIGPDAISELELAEELELLEDLETLEAMGEDIEFLALLDLDVEDEAW